MIPPYLADTRVAKLTFFPEGGNLICLLYTSDAADEL